MEKGVSEHQLSESDRRVDSIASVVLKSSGAPGNLPPELKSATVHFSGNACFGHNPNPNGPDSNPSHMIVRTATPTFLRETDIFSSCSASAPQGAR
jgi:hypothetical protein